MAKDILKEAIADAKAVREVALQNAKAALEEAFTPKLQSMLSAKLTEELDEGENIEETYMDETDDMEETYMDEVDVDEDVDEVTGMDEGMDEDLDEEINLEEILSELELEEAKDSEEKPVEEAKDEDLDEAKKDEDKDDVKEAKDEDLDEAKNDKEEKLDEMGKPIYKAEYANDSTYKADVVNEGEEFDLDALLEEINNLDEKKDDDEVNEGDFGETKGDEDVSEYSGFNVAPGQSGGTDDTYKAMKAAADGASDLSDFLNSIQEIPGALKLLSNPRVFQNWASQIKFTQENVSVDEVQTELEETKKVLKTVTGELNEVNLLNSKLLYVNRIFKANTLDEAQKLRVVET